VQTPQEMTDRLEQKVSALHEVAERIYAKWSQGLKKH
jgi:hypothetical protein